MKVILIKLLPNISNFLNYPCQKLLEAVFRRRCVNQVNDTVSLTCHRKIHFET